MKVRCRLCVHELDGFCQKKFTAQKPVKIELNKPRTCGVFKEDGFRVLTDYRKREAHTKRVKSIQQQNLTVFQELTKVQEDLASRKKKLTLEQVQALPVPNVESPLLTAKESADDV